MKTVAFVAGMATSTFLAIKLFERVVEELEKMD